MCGTRTLRGPRKEREAEGALVGSRICRLLLYVVWHTEVRWGALKL